jgi:hypothetical protein
MSVIPFEHKMAAHCESGTLSALLSYNGFPITEPLVLGISGGIFFVYIKTPKMQFPVFDMRSKPGDLRKNMAKQLGIKFFEKTYRDPVAAKKELISVLDKGVPASVQVDMFYMEYIPAHMRVHFNAHFVIVTGYENDRFTISDCYYPSLSQVAAESLDSGRFAKSDFAPKGFMFHPLFVPKPADVDMKKAILTGIRMACRNMVKLPVPFIGVKGIRKFANSIPTWGTYARNEDQLSHAIMSIHIVLEERGTGGGGFRFMYASFLQQAAQILGRPEFSDMSKRMMGSGDKWREISLFVARIGKNRDLSVAKLSEVRDMVMDRADEEQVLFTELLAMTK